jgi:hypothetical protein
VRDCGKWIVAGKCFRECGRARLCCGSGVLWLRTECGWERVEWDRSRSHRRSSKSKKGIAGPTPTPIPTILTDTAEASSPPLRRHVTNNRMHWSCQPPFDVLPRRHTSLFLTPKCPFDTMRPNPIVAQYKVVIVAVEVDRHIGLPNSDSVFVLPTACLSGCPMVPIYVDQYDVQALSFVSVEHFINYQRAQLYWAQEDQNLQKQNSQSVLSRS